MQRLSGRAAARPYDGRRDRLDPSTVTAFDRSTVTAISLMLGLWARDARPYGLIPIVLFFVPSFDKYL
jgi:hypothetical protein